MVALGMQTAAPQSSGVARKLRVGDSARYVVRVELERGETVTSVESRVVETVEKVEDDGTATVRTKYLSVKFGSVAGGTRPDDVTVFGPDGAVLSVAGNDANALRIARALAVPASLSSGGSWTFEQRPVSQPPAPLGRTACVMDGSEELSGIPCARVRFEYREGAESGEPLVAKGMFWLALDGGRLVKLEAELAGLPGIPGKDSKARVTVEQEPQGR